MQACTADVRAVDVHDDTTTMSESLFSRTYARPADVDVIELSDETHWYADTPS